VSEEMVDGEVKALAPSELSYDAKCALTIPIARPLAGKKLGKKLYKCCKTAVSTKGVKRGTKEVAKAIRKGEKGFVVIAGDVSPIDVISHFPVVCEENKIPYCYIPAKSDLGASLNSNTPVSIVLVTKQDVYKDKYKECVKFIKELPSIY